LLKKKLLKGIFIVINIIQKDKLYCSTNSQIQFN